MGAESSVTKVSELVMWTRGGTIEPMNDSSPKNFTLVGPKVGLPSFEDILKLTKSLSRRDATPEEVEAARKIYDRLGKPSLTGEEET